MVSEDSSSYSLLKRSLAGFFCKTCPFTKTTMSRDTSSSGFDTLCAESNISTTTHMALTVPAWMHSILCGND